MRCAYFQYFNRVLEIEHEMMAHINMESSPLEDEGGNFIGPWGTLNFHLLLGGGLSQIGGLKIFRSFFVGEGGEGGGGTKGFFSTGGIGEVPESLPHGSKI